MEDFRYSTTLNTAVLNNLDFPTGFHGEYE